MVVLHGLVTLVEMKRTNIISYHQKAPNISSRWNKISLCEHSTFQVDVIKFNYVRYDKRTRGLLRVETTKDKMISLCGKMYCVSDITEEKI